MEMEEMYALGFFFSRRIFYISLIVFFLVSKQEMCGEGHLIKVSFFSQKVIH